MLPAACGLPHGAKDRAEGKLGLLGCGRQYGNTLGKGPTLVVILYLR